MGWDESSVTEIHHSRGQERTCVHISQPRFSITMNDRLRHGTYVTNQKTGALQAHSAAKPLDGIRCDYAKAKAMALIGLPTAAQDTARGFFG